MTHTLSIVLTAMAMMRIVLGVAPFLVAGLATRLLGFPREQDSPTARLMARFFGVRDFGLGVLVFYALRHPAILPFVLVFNAAMDGGDFVSASIPLVGRHGIDRAALLSGAMAGTAGIAWLIVWRLIA
jgi:hypothetical protein